MYYSVTIGTGAGVIFFETTMRERVKHEVEHLPNGWTIIILEYDDDNKPIRKCEPEEFMEDEMSKNRKEWYDAIMCLAIGMVGVAVLMYFGCWGRYMNPWPLTLGSLGVAGVLFIIAAIIHEGRDVVALPQALWMAIQDWFKRRI